MKLDKKLNKLALTKSNPAALQSLFGSSDLIPMWVADMDFQVAKPIQKALKNRIKHSGFSYEYKPASFFEAQKKWYKNEYNISLKKEDVLFSPTVTTAITIIIEQFSEINDGIIFQPPVFNDFKNVIRHTKRRIVKNPLKLNNGKYQIDFNDLEFKAKQEKNKILILCNPHNPLGRVWSKDDLVRIVEICKKNDVLIISDEVHKDIILFENKFTSMLTFQDVYHRIVICNSEAKTFNLCSILDSNVIVPNEEIRNLLKKIFIKYNLGRTNALSSVALETAFKKGKPWLQKVLKTIEFNVETIQKELEEKESKIKLFFPQGTYQVWLYFGDLFSDTIEMFNYITKNAKVAMNAGHWYGREGALFMRMNIATSNKKVLKAIGKIINAEKNLIK